MPDSRRYHSRRTTPGSDDQEPVTLLALLRRFAGRHVTIAKMAQEMGIPPHQRARLRAGLLLLRSRGHVSVEHVSRPGRIREAVYGFPALPEET